MTLPRSRSLLLVLAGLATLVLTASAFQQAQSAPLSSVPWGLSVSTNRIYYAVGDSLAARFQIANSTGQTTWGWAPMHGFHGCDFTFAVHDALGQAVWVPGEVFGGTYQGPPCLFAERDTLHTPGSTYGVGRLIPLVYQNPDGIGTLGTNLPPGAYQLRVQVTFQGPKHVSGAPTSPGTDFSATVPFRIE